MQGRISIFRTGHRALAFVILIGVVSLFADCTYEGSRSILGPYLASLSANATIIGIVTGFGELLGYGLRVFSGQLADSTQRFWPITIVGYAVQMSAVPAIALTHNWQSAAALIILERVGKAIRNPPRDMMLSHAAKQAGGAGWAFGLHEALDQSGAMFGPLAVSAVLALRHDFHEAFAILLIPGAITLVLVGIARLTYPRPEELEVGAQDLRGHGLSRLYWIYMAAAALIAAGFADYPVIAFHFKQAQSVPDQWIPVFYAVAMAVSGSGSLAFGRLFDRHGFGILIALTAVSLLFAPLVFLGSFWIALFGVAIWGLGMGVHESIIPAVVMPLVVPERRASAFGIFTAGYGIAWFFGSAVIGVLYDRSVPLTIAFCAGLQILAIPILVIVARRYRYVTAWADK